MGLSRSIHSNGPQDTLADLPEGPFLILWALRTLYQAPDGDVLVRYEFEALFGRDEAPLAFAALGAAWNALRYGQRRASWQNRVPSAERVSETEGVLIRLLSVALHGSKEHLHAYADYLMWPEVADGCTKAVAYLAPLVHQAELDWPQKLAVQGFVMPEYTVNAACSQATGRRPASVAIAP